MKRLPGRLVALSGLVMACLFAGLEQQAMGQIVSAAPTILQSVVLHPCVATATCGVEMAAAGEDIIPPVRSSGALSGRLATAPRASSGAGTTTYKSEAAVSTQVRAIFVMSLAKRLNGAAAAAIAKNMRESDPVERWSGMVARQGLKPGDLADALASYWVLNWAMANGGESSGAAMQAVREQVRWAVANRPALRRLTDAEKQAMAEEAMLNFVYEETGYLQALEAGNNVMLERFAEGAERRFRVEMAVDLRSLTMTERGLAAKR